MSNNSAGGWIQYLCGDAMRNGVRQSGFSLMEMVVVIATILILASVLLGVGKRLMIRANIDLTSSGLEVLNTALQQYYTDFGKFPVTEKDITGDGIIDAYDESHLKYDLSGTVAPNGTIDDLINNRNDPAAASSTALFYFLDQTSNSRMIVEALTDTLISSKDASGVAIKLRPAGGASDGSNDIDLPRFIDAWGTSIRYEYLNGTAFPTLTSAGPDKKFATPDDIVK